MFDSYIRDYYNYSILIQNRKALDCMAMFWTMPKDASVIIRELPPADKSGKGMPVTGKRPMFMPTLTKTCTSSIKNTPPAIYIPKSSLAFPQILSRREKI